ncbi:MAG: exopolysaccharide Pel transporter PelG [Opitutales bacterium]
MAGIGFQLNKILDKGSYAGVVQAYGYAALVSSGPWVISILCLALFGAWVGWGDSGMESFFGAIMYVYAFSLVLTGPLQLVLTRYAADLLYLEDQEKVYPSFLAALGGGMFVAALLGAIFFIGFVPGSLLFRCMAAQLFSLVCGIWISMVFVSAIRNYWGVLVAFLTGFGLSLTAAAAGFQVAGAEGAMPGFLLGQMVLLLILVGLIRQEFNGKESFSFLWFVYFRKHWALALCGFVYNLGIWGDKFIHWWFSPYRLQVAGALWASPVYDQAIYLSYLAIVPGMAVFFLAMEARFAEKYEMFFKQVIDKGSLDSLRQRREEMLRALQGGIMMVLRVQGLVTIFLILGAGPLLGQLGLNAMQVTVFQISLVGVFLLVIFLSFLTVLFYLDKPRAALFSCAVFAAVNIGVTFLSLAAGERFYGSGLVAGAACGAFFAAQMANRHIRDLIYETFSSQPLST